MKNPFRRRWRVVLVSREGDKYEIVRVWTKRQARHVIHIFDGIPEMVAKRNRLGAHNDYEYLG